VSPGSRRIGVLDSSAGLRDQNPTSPVEPDLLRFQEFFHGEVDILGDLAQQDRRDVASLVNRHRGSSPIWVAKLLVRSALARLSEAQLVQDRDDFLGFEDRQFGHD